MKEYKIAVIPGDGIGQEVTPEGVRVLEAVSEVTGDFKLNYEYFPWGCDYYLKNGSMMPSNGIDILRPFDAIYFGAVGLPAQVPDHVSLHGLLIKIRLEFDQYICLRPGYLLPGVKSPLGGKKSGDIDFVIVNIPVPAADVILANPLNWRWKHRSLRRLVRNALFVMHSSWHNPGKSISFA